MATQNYAEKLAHVRAALRREQATALLIPVSDAFQNEYRAPRDERLAWLTGFDGSAGFGIVTLTKVAVFVDGRYTVQAANQLDLDLHEALPLSARESWIKEALCEQVVLYDPWLFTVNERNVWQDRAEKGHFALVPSPENIIDTQWLDRPVQESRLAFVHSMIYAGQSHTDKLDQVAVWLNDQGLDSYLFTQSESLNWLLNVRGHDLEFTPIINMYGVMQGDGTIDVFTRLNDVPVEVRDYLGSRVRLHDLADIQNYLCQLPGQTIGFDPARTPSAMHDWLTIGKLKAISDPCICMRSMKNPTGQAGARACHVRDGAALTTFLHWLYQNYKGTTEIGAADQLEYFRRQQDFFHGLSFPTIAGVGANGAIVHYRATPATDTELTKNHLFLLDSGAQYLDGTTDVTRTIALGTPTAEQRDRFTRVLKGHIALARAIFPAGTCGEQLDALARQYLWQAGLDFDHGTGHGVGSFLNVHEGPQRISRAGANAPLKPGMILSNEPGYYKTGEYGIRIESLLLVVPAESGFLSFETLTMAPIDRALIDEAMLSIEETQWLNTYHRRAYDTLASLVSEDARAWLRDATMEIL